MNAGNAAANLGISERRRALIEGLECAGYDGAPGAPRNWREAYSDEELVEAACAMGLEDAP